MYYYQIAALTLESRYRLQSFEAFSCTKRSANVTLEATDDIPRPGKDQSSGSIIHRVQPDGWFFRFSEEEESGLFINSDYTCLRMCGQKETTISGMDEWLVRIALECWLARHGYVSLHAAAVEIDGQAIAFTGPSGMGKSTRAEMMIRSLGAKLINGDRPLIGVKDLVLYGVPWDGKEQCFRNESFPLLAICEVRRSKTIYIRKLDTQQRRKLLMRQCFMPMWDTETAMLQMANITRMASSFRIVRVFCGPGEDDIRTLFSILRKQEYKKEEQEIKAKSGPALELALEKNMSTFQKKSVRLFNGTVSLNDAATFLWEKLQNPVSRDDLLTALMDEYNINKKTASADLDMLLECFADTV